MPRVTIPLEYIAELPLETGPPSDCYTTVDGGPFAALLWLEIRQVERYARMSEFQAAVFELHLRGVRVSDIARAFCRRPQTIQGHLEAALRKAEGYPHRGLLTCLVESFGWSAVLEHVFSPSEKYRYRVDAPVGAGK